MLFLQKVYDKPELQSDIKRILNNPVNVKKTDIITYYPWEEFVIQPKADGTRALIV